VAALRATHPAPEADEYRRAGWWRPDTLWTAFTATAGRRPEACALIEDDVRLGFGELRERAESLAAGLHALGIRAGDVIALQLPNWWETVAVYLATARLGAAANPVLPIARERELRFVLGRSGARILFIPGSVRDVDHRALLGAIRADLPALEHVVTVRAAPGPGMTAWDAVPAHAPPPPATDADVIALLMYTSGTTADPKGVLHSHATLLAEARSLAAVHALGPADRVLMPSPLTHVSGLVHAVLAPAALGTSAVLMPRWDPARALDLIRRERVTYLVGAPTFLRDLAEASPPDPDPDRSLRLFSCGGADVDPAMLRRAAARLGCVAKRVYGSTEFPTISTSGPDDPPERCIDGEGRPIAPVRIRLVGEHDRPVPVGNEGEILAQGPECFLGYHDPAMNAEAFTPDGWFRTGDLGILDAGGYLRITGRRKDVIIRKGENVSAREVEEMIATHPAVREVAVIGVPDPGAGEIVCAVLRLRPGAAAPDVSELGRHLLAAGLSKRKLPERVEVVGDFPRTDSGKVAKRALRERLVPRG
jgi:cyclohexanecarboxylate-CoA ligase